MAWSTPRTWSAGETLTAANFNTYIRDQQLAMAPHLIVRKTSDQSVTSSTVLVNDTALVMAVAANEIWQFQFVLVFVAPTVPDIKIAFTFPTSGVLSACAPGPTAADAFGPQQWAATTSPSATVAFGNSVGAGTNPTALVITGVFVNSTNAGNLQLQWAQNTSDAASTIVKTNSTLWAVKLA